MTLGNSDIKKKMLHMKEKSPKVGISLEKTNSTLTVFFSGIILIHFDLSSYKKQPVILNEAEWSNQSIIILTVMTRSFLIFFNGRSANEIACILLKNVQL